MHIYRKINVQLKQKENTIYVPEPIYTYFQDQSALWSMHWSLQEFLLLTSKAK